MRKSEFTPNGVVRLQQVQNMTRRVLMVVALAVVFSGAGEKCVGQDREPIVRSDGLRTITIVGTATAFRTPDVAQLSVGSETRRDTAREALIANNKATSGLMDELKKSGIVAHDVKTDGLNLSPIYEGAANDRLEKKPGMPAPKIIGYRISNSVVITVREVTKVGELIDMVVKTGVNEIGGLSFEISDPVSTLRDLRRQALTDAREKAEEVAKEVEMTLGLPLSISVDDSSSPSNEGIRYNRLEAPRYEKAVPISAGLKELKASVMVVYELKPKK